MDAAKAPQDNHPKVVNSTEIIKMQTQIKITNKDDKVFISSPYSSRNVATFRSKGGKFLKAEWVFPDTESVHAMINELYGSSNELVVIKIAKEHEALLTYDGEYTVGGYKIASRRYRDSAVEWAEGCWLISGKVPSSGGSQKNPSVQAEENSTFAVVVRLDFAERLGLEIIKRQTTNKDSLIAEKQALLNRLAEIEKALEA